VTPQEITVVTPLLPVAFDGGVRFAVSGSRLISDASRDVSCKFEKERTNRREIVGKIASGSDERESFPSSACVLATADATADPALLACQSRIEATEVSQFRLIDHAVESGLGRDERNGFCDDVWRHGRCVGKVGVKRLTLFPLALSIAACSSLMVCATSARLARVKDRPAML
jgi:hypothetical protein